MRLERILLKSFGCFERRDIHLEEGINLVFGPNFSGKSTLVNAIFFTLTGKPIVPKVALNAMAQSGMPSGTAGLTFSDQQQCYQLFRSTQGEVQLRLSEDSQWRILFSGKKGADEALRQYLSFNQHHLSAATFLREGEIFEFLSRQPADRRDVLYALLGIDRLMAVRERFIEGRRIAKREEKRIQEQQRGIRITTVKSQRDEMARIETELKKLEDEYELLSSKASEGHDSALTDELRQTQNRLRKQVESLRQERATTLSGFSDAEHLSSAIAEIQKAVEQANELEEARERLIQKVGSLTSQLEMLDNECQTLRQLLERADGHCPTCQQSVQRDVLEGIVSQKEAISKQHQHELETQQQALVEHTANVNALHELRQRQQLLEGRIKQLRKIDTQLAALNEELNGVEKRLTALTPPEQTQPAASVDVAELAERRRQLKYRIDSLHRRLLALNKEEAVMAHKLEELHRLREAADRILRTRLSFELACDGVEKTIASLQRTILEPAEVELQRWLERMDLFQSAKIDLKSQHLLPALNINGVERNLMLLSGSEKMILYLCFKVALSKALGDPGFFVFDDPTLHLDAERKYTMIDFIRQLAKNYQVIVTSNDADIRDGLVGANVIETVAA